MLLTASNLSTSKEIWLPSDIIVCIVNWHIICLRYKKIQKLLGEYRTWLQSNNACQGSLYKESFEKRWPSFIVPSLQSQFEASELLKTKHEVGIKVIEDFSAAAASKLFEQEIREVVSSWHLQYLKQYSIKWISTRLVEQNE